MVNVYGASSFNYAFLYPVTLTGTLVDCTASTTGACAAIVTQ